ncbi:hypothetical protein WJX81_008468 [Elliptochloris bilobata]|uniref:DUF4460 domain-containing protein n=1 Tax=Elliptochloris bilobata TaxID=381761 RepID=A0AAW1SKF6_9CHLO
MQAEDKRMMRAVVRRVHPDLFAAHPYERAKNTESLKLLNGYVDALGHGARVDGARMEFWVLEAGALAYLEADLPPHGSLGPLFYAFGLISAEDLRSGAGTYATGQGDTNFLLWLSETVASAVRTAEQHEVLKQAVRAELAAVESRFDLAAVQVGGEFAVSTAEQRRQLLALKTLDTCLAALTAAAPGRFAGLSVRLYHPESAPMDLLDYGGQGDDRSRPGTIQSFVADDGCLHIVADRASIQAAVAGLDLERARLLTRLSLFWVRRVRELAPALETLLGVQHVWCDTRSEESSQRFVLWAGYVLESRAEFEAALQRRAFSFSMLVHSDLSSALVDFLPSSSVLQVRSDCPPPRLLAFLVGEAGAAANEAAEAVATSKAEEEALLEQVREALAAKQVIRLCSAVESDRVAAAARRLLQNAPLIRQSVDLSGASIAIDDCYELWESGFISIPFDFQVSDLQPELQRLLSSGARRQHCIR